MLFWLSYEAIQKGQNSVALLLCKTFHIDFSCNSSKYIIQATDDIHIHTLELGGKQKVVIKCGYNIAVYTDQTTQITAKETALICLGTVFTELILPPPALGRKRPTGY